MTKKVTADSRSKAERFYRTIGSLLLKAALLLFLATLIFLIYLDAKVTRTFSGQKWQVPAQVYSRSLMLYEGKHLTLSQFVNELEQLRYRKVPQLTGTGQYVIAANKVSVFRRSFTFTEGYENAERFSVTFRGNTVYQLQDAQTKPLESARLEPQLIEHLLSAEQEERELIRLEQVPEIIKDTLLLVEDRDFYHHYGVSPLAILRALWVNLTAGRTVQGGSTLTQQLAKNMYLNSNRTLWRKLNEAFIALVLEYRFSKDQILEAYFNEVFIGQNQANAVHGFGLGSRFYFGKPLTELAEHEYALLIGLVKGPSFYDPRRYPERSQQRRDLVLRLMFEQHLLGAEQYRYAVEQPLQIIARSQYRPSGYPAYLDLVKKELRQLNLSNDVLDSGIKIFTYLDPQSQLAAEQAVTQQLADREPDLQAAMLVADYRAAALLAVVGGRDTKFPGFNRALNAQRQIGSIIKPVIYLEALAQTGRYTLASVLEDQPLVLKSNNQDWRPENFDQTFRGKVPLITALSESLNVPTVRLGLQIGLPAINNGLTKLGLRRKIKLHPAALLGALELTPLEVTQLYQSIANQGVHQSLAAIDTVTDQFGAVVFQRPVQQYRAYSENAAYLLQYGLMQATVSGTARSLQRQFPGRVFAGKTGTSSDYRDSWFSGFDQDTLVTVWVGRDDNQVTGLTGSNGALPVFSRYFSLQRPYPLQLQMPEQIILQRFSATTGQSVGLNCHNSLLLPAISVEMYQINACEND